MKVIIAEDDSVTRAILVTLLHRAGHDVVSYCDGLSLWKDISKTEGSKLLILDWHMPGLDGVEICKRIRNSKMKHETYVILLSSDDSVTDVVDGLDSGADDFMSKPVSRAELLARLRVAERTLGYQAELARQINEMEDTINGRYMPKRLVGTGGLGSVYEGMDRLLQRKVAIKVINPNAEANKNIWEAALEEAKLTANLQHPNIISVFDCGKNTQGAFVVMELFEGDTLEKYTDTHVPIDLALFRQIVVKALMGLSEAHRNEILHCDLKPSNIMIRKSRHGGEEIELKILDFGLAKFKGQDYEKEEEGGCIMASIYYLAPEIIVGKPIDFRTDLYSLGHVFFHLLARRPSYDKKSNQEMLLCHVKGEYPDVREFHPRVSDNLAEWLDHLMSHRPKDRYNTAEEALEAFETYVGSETPKSSAPAA